MSNLQTNLRLLAREAVGSAKKRRQISKCLKNAGFKSLGAGAWLGFRNRDVVSGFVIEGSPLDTYISTFVLPAFDRRSFVTWGLGERIVHCDFNIDTQVECGEAIDRYVSDIADIRSPSSLMAYLDAKQVAGHYPIWVRYICYLRLSQFDEARAYLDDSKRSRLHHVQVAQLQEVESSVASHDATGVLRVLQNWSDFSERIFGPLDQTFNHSETAKRPS